MLYKSFFVSMVTTAFIYSNLLYAKDCNFACETIPDVESSYLAWGENSLKLQDSDSIKIGVWNIFKGKKDAFEKEFSQLIKDSDILMLQEIYWGEGREQSFLNQDSFYGQLSISFLMTGGIPTGVANMSRSLMHYVEHQKTELLEPFVKSPKANMLSLVPLTNGKKLLIVNLHGLNLGSVKKLEHQLSLAKPHIISHTGPVVFAGDFNTHSRARQRMTDAWMTELGLSRIVYPNDNRNFPLDHIYYKGLQVVDKVLDLDSKGSDHPILWADFAAD